MINLISSEWSYGNWAWFTGSSPELLKDAYSKGYRYAEVRENDADITVLKYKPKSVARRTMIASIDKFGRLTF